MAVSLAGCSEKETPTSPTTNTPTCTYTVSTTTFNMAGSGGSATLSVNAGSGCAWTVSGGSSFVTITTPTAQTGPGSVTFSVPENPGDTRTTTLNVAGQTVSISQAPNDQVYGNWGGTISKGAGCPAVLPASVDWTGTIRRTSGSSNEFAIAIPILAVSTVVNLNINGNSLQFAVPIDSLYTFNATLSNDHRSLNGTFSGGSCSGTWSGSRR